MYWCSRINRAGRMSVGLILAITLLAITAAANQPQGDELVLPRDGVLLREGAGNFFPIVEILPAGTALIQTGEQTGWLNVWLRENTGGWISGNVMLAAEERPDLFPDEDRPPPSRKVNLQAIGAMIKGLSDQYGVADDEAGRLLLDAPVNAHTARHFRKAFPSTKDLPRGKRVDPDLAMLPEYLALSPVLAADILESWGGPREDLTAYGNQILYWLAERAGVGNLEPRLYVSKNESNSVCLPGGWIVVGGELLDKCEDESEFAAIIAHELSHALHHHGYKALRAEAWRLRAHEARSRLREEMGEDDDVEDLRAFAEKALQQARRRHDLPMELEADEAAVHMLAASGYDAGAMLRLLKKLRGEGGDRMVGRGRISLAWLHSNRELDERIEALEKTMRKLSRKAKKSLVEERRFRKRFRESVR